MKWFMQTSIPAFWATSFRWSLALSFSLVMAGTVQANDTNYSLGQNVSIRYYGWLHYAVQSVDDGVTTTSNLVDVTNAASRFGFFIEPVDGGPLSFQFETSLGFRPSTKTSQTNTPDALHWTRKDLRQVQLILDTAVGTFRFGQGSMPTDGVAESDLGETVVVAKSTIPESHGSFEFRNTAGALSGITISRTFSNFDGARRHRLRFDTKPQAGFSLALAYGQEVLTSGNSDEYYGLALRYGGTAGELRIKGAIGVSFERATGKTQHHATLGSVSVLHQPTGLNLSVAAGRAGGSGGAYVYIKGGWNVDLISVGTTKFIAEGFRGEDYLSVQSRSEMWGLAIIQEFEAQNMEIYTGFRGFSYSDTTPTAYQDVGALQVGARWRF